MNNSISTGAYLVELKAQVSGEERAALIAGVMPAISAFNRSTMLRMLSMDATSPGSVDTRCSQEMTDALQTYLNRYMADKPEGHKWIILSCLFLVLVAREPMHPQPIVHWLCEDGRYHCPAREDDEGSLCRFCVCESTSQPERGCGCQSIKRENNMT